MTVISEIPLPPPEDALCGSEISIVVCRKCRLVGASGSEERPGEKLAESAARAMNGSKVRVHEVACLGNCQQGISAAIIASQGWSYLFGGLSPADGRDLAEGGKLLAHSGGGQILWSDWPDALKRGFMGCIPSFENLAD